MQKPRDAAVNLKKVINHKQLIFYVVVTMYVTLRSINHTTPKTYNQLVTAFHCDELADNDR